MGRRWGASFILRESDPFQDQRVKTPISTCCARTRSKSRCRYRIWKDRNVTTRGWSLARGRERSSMGRRWGASFILRESDPFQGARVKYPISTVLILVTVHKHFRQASELGDTYCPTAQGTIAYPHVGCEDLRRHSRAVGAGWRHTDTDLHFTVYRSLPPPRREGTKSHPSSAPTASFALRSASAAWRGVCIACVHAAAWYRTCTVPARSQRLSVATRRPLLDGCR